MAACTNCNGCGEVVTTVLVWDAQRGEFITLSRAVPCEDCGGSGNA